MQTELDAINVDETDYLLGLFENVEMKYNLDVLAEDATASSEPTLTQMVEKSIGILSKNDKGFFLLVESGRIDDAHHSNNARLALDETAELSKAVAMARSRLATEDTLILVTAAHSHTMTYNGYPVGFLLGFIILNLIEPFFNSFVETISLVWPMVLMIQSIICRT